MSSEYTNTQIHEYTNNERPKFPAAFLKPAGKASVKKNCIKGHTV